MQDSDLESAVKSALAILIASLPYAKEPSPTLTTAWLIVLRRRGASPAMVEAAVADALELPAFPSPGEFSDLCERHRPALRLGESSCLPVNTAARSLDPRGQQTVKDHMRAVFHEPSAEEVAEADRLRRSMIEAYHQRREGRV